MFMNHPATEYQGIAPENVFFVSSDRHVQLGYGCVIDFFQHELYPEQPLHIYAQMDAQLSAKPFLFGALFARAGEIRDQAGTPARFYTQVDPKDRETLDFYVKMGMKNDDSEDLYSYYLPYGRAGAPMGFEYWQSPLATPQDEAALLERMNLYRIQPVNRDYLTLWRQQEHFLALAYYRQGAPVCEAVFTGSGMTATLVSIYTVPQYRGQKLASQLIDAASVHLRDQGVSQLYAHIFKRNQPQNGLMRHLKGQFIQPVNYLPGINMTK